MTSSMSLSLESLPPQRVTKLKLMLMRVPQPQYQVAALAGIHPSVMSMYSRGEKPIRDKHLITLCDLFRCEPEDILGWEDE